MEQRLTASEKQTLLALARTCIAQYLKDESCPQLPQATGLLAEKCGAFVTLHKHGELRGCIGSMVGYRPLVETVQEMAIAAATEDPRFDRVRPEELDQIDLEISVLTPLRRITDVNEIIVGTHGILLRQGRRQGVLLPQVAREWGWDREAFLQNTCLKAGLPEDAWKDPATSIEIFSAEVFGETREPLTGKVSGY
jgi:AmmeMemoRadiSam system protein A